MDPTIILAIVDEKHAGKLVSEFTRAGFYVHVVEDGGAALHWTRATHPEFLVLGLWTPARTGFEVIDALRRDETCAGTRIIVLDDQPDADAALEARASGAAAVWPASTPADEVARRVLDLFRNASIGEKHALPGGES